MDELSSEKADTGCRKQYFLLLALLMILLTMLLPQKSISQSLTGQVFDIEGHPLSKVEICIYNSDYHSKPDKNNPNFPSGAFASARSTSSGRYHFQQIPAGNFSIIGKKGNLWFYRYRSADDSSSTRLLSDTLKKPGSLYFPVILEKQTDMHYVNISLAGTPFSARSTRNGQVHLTNLPAGSYLAILKAEARGYNALQCSLRIHTATADTFSDTLTLSYNPSTAVQNITPKANQKPSFAILETPAEKKIKENLIESSQVISSDQEFRIRILTDSTTINPFQKIHLKAALAPPNAVVKSWEWSINSSPYRITATSDTSIIAPLKTGKFNCILKATGKEGFYCFDTITFNVRSSSLQVFAQGEKDVGIFKRIQLSAYTNSNSPVISLSWDIGNSGNFIVTADGTISIGPFRSPRKKVPCIVRAIDETGSSAFDTILLNADYIWEKLTPAPGSSERKSHVLIPFKNSVWIIGGSSSDLWYSDDGKNWKPGVESAPFGPRYGHASVVFNERLWVIGGKIGHDSLPGDIWNSVDGKNWEKIAEHSFLKRYYHSATIFQDRIFVIGGLNDSAVNPCFHDIWISENGISWTRQNAVADFAARYGHGAVVFNNSLFLIGGLYDDFSGSKTINDIWKSQNGFSWQKVNDNLSFPDNLFLSFLVYDQRIWAIGGYLKNNPMVFSNIWVSADGVSWNQDSDKSKRSYGFHVTGTVFNNQIMMSPSASEYIYSLQ